MWTAGVTGKLPILLNYCAAHTFRWSGGDKMNPQNLKRGGALRKAIMAPPGKRIIVNDQSQIEARIVVWLAKQNDILQSFRDFDAKTGPDIYELMASKIYRKEIKKITKEDRLIGKVATLGMGFGMGWKRLKFQLALGFLGPPMEVSKQEARRIVSVYRASNAHVVNFWHVLDTILAKMAAHKDFEYILGPLIFKYESVILPNGLSMKYPYMTYDGDNVTYMTRNGRANIWGGYFLENIAQALARCIIAENMLTISKRNFIGTMTHDEIVSIADKKHAKRDFHWQQKVMTAPISWAPGLPLAVDGGYAKRYSK